MAKLINPKLFSSHFGIAPEAMRKAGLFDPILNSDSLVFIDPLLIPASDNETVRVEGHKLLRENLGNIVRLLAASRNEGDIAWRSAAKLLHLSERPETCLGYGGTSTSGSSRSSEIRTQVLRTAKEIIDLGESDPEIITLMGMFERGVGPDTIGDITTDAIMPTLAKITSEFCQTFELALTEFESYPDYPLLPNPYQTHLPVILVPIDILRDLPLAADWSDVSRVTFENERIRDQFNLLVGDVTKATLVEKKEALKQTALTSLANFRAIFRGIIGASDAYDPSSDPLNLFRFREMLAAESKHFGLVTVWFRVLEWNNCHQGEQSWHTNTMKSSSARRCVLH